MKQKKIDIGVEVLRRMYEHEEKSIATIAQEFDVSQTKIRNALIRHGIPRRKACQQCGRKPRRRDRMVDSHGYVYILIPDHPHANRKGYVLEHRLVMEKVLGRYLEPREVVHHIDENKQNNQPDNLKVYASESDHQRHGHGSGLELSAPTLKNLYLDQGKSMQKIAEMFGVTRSVITLLLKKYGIPSRSSGGQPKLNQSLTEATLRRMYLEERMSARRIAQELGVGATTVEWYLNKYDIPLRQKGWKLPPRSEAWRQKMSANAKRNHLQRQRSEIGRFV